MRLCLPPIATVHRDLERSFQPAWVAQPLCAVINVFNAKKLTPRVQPSIEYPLGADRLGRDLLSRILWGMRTSVIVSLAAILTGSIFLGVTLGAISGFMGGWVDALISRIGELFLAFPGLLLVILISVHSPAPCAGVGGRV